MSVAGREAGEWKVAGEGDYGSRARMRDRVVRSRSSPGTVRRCQNVPRPAA